MGKITFLGAGSTVFAKNVLGDCMLTPALQSFELALFDIDHERLRDSERMLNNLVASTGSKCRVVAYHDRKEALRGAKYVVNAIQVGGYDPCTITDFEIPKNTACAKRSPIRSASAEFSAICAPSRSCSTSQETCRRSVRMLGSSIIRIRWRY